MLGSTIVKEARGSDSQNRNNRFRYALNPCRNKPESHSEISKSWIIYTSLQRFCEYIYDLLQSSVVLCITHTLKYDIN